MRVSCGHELREGVSINFANVNATEEDDDDDDDREGRRPGYNAEQEKHTEIWGREGNKRQ